ncbi:hypothetical protein [Pelagicoccus sp. SDUM812003]|uniref:hypothetical protein n=1 Tax=Pelagicoccus sp. SDUM812003 TaxID=3041267 RepID=UPI00280EF71C|nr:hypothetical protein [Pelagicoccus sp. SDUM812003]MDQ8205728.1 hypothetical protein [Pelagicoccus sp. SDUM812003]
MESDHQPLPWPDSSTNLFVEGAHFQLSPTLPVTFNESNWTSYAEGYYLAAERLVEFVEQKLMYGGLLIYPITFMYRHYTELRIKELILRISRLNGNDVSSKVSGHDLKKLWSRCRPLIESLEPTPEPQDISNVERLVLELHYHDPKSTDARYPDNPNVFSGMKSIDMVNLRLGMSKLAAFMNGTTDMVIEYSTNP